MYNFKVSPFLYSIIKLKEIISDLVYPVQYKTYAYPVNKQIPHENETWNLSGHKTFFSENISI